MSLYCFTQMYEHNCYKFAMTLYSTQFGQVMIDLAQNSRHTSNRYIPITQSTWPFLEDLVECVWVDLSSKFMILKRQALRHLTQHIQTHSWVTRSFDAVVLHIIKNKHRKTLPFPETVKISRFYLGCQTIMRHCDACGAHLKPTWQVVRERTWLWKRMLLNVLNYQSVANHHHFHQDKRNISLLA